MSTVGHLLHLLYIFQTQRLDNAITSVTYKRLRYEFKK